MAETISDRDVKSLLHPFTRPSTHEKDGPLVIVRGDGAWIYDDKGRAYLEAAAGLWCTSLGFSERRLAEAAYRQMNTLPFMHLFTSRTHSPAVELAERLLAIAPVPMAKVFFANSGSEAADTVIKMVWFYNNTLGRSEKKKILARIDGFHGSSIGSGSLTGIVRNHRKFDLPIPNVVHIPRTHYYLDSLPGESEEAFSSRMVDQLDRQIQDEDPSTVAAYIAEPIMGAGGAILPPKDYFPKVAEVIAKHDMLMLADEVICGFCRTGSMWGSQTFGLRPDILTTAKQLSSGYAPISGVMVNEKVYRVLFEGSDEVGVFAHGFTTTGHPTSSAVALECLKIYEERDMLGHVARVGSILQNGLRDRFASHKYVGEVRGVGLIAAVQFVQDRDERRLFPPEWHVGDYCASRALDHGLVLRALGDAMAFSPPLIIEEHEVESLLDRFERAMRDTVMWVESMK